MKPIKKKSIAMYITFIVLIVFLTGATCTIGECSVTFNDYTGKAVNIKADATTDFWKSSNTLTLEGATVYLYAYDTSTGSYNSNAAYSATVDAYGSFTFGSPTPGKYKLTGSQSGWTFVPRYVEVLDSSSLTDDLYAYPTDDSAYTIIAGWKQTDMDVDLTLTYGAPDAATTLPWDTGYGQTPDLNIRYRIMYERATAGVGSKDCVLLNRDVTGDDDASIPRVETISIYSAAWFVNGDVLKVYVDAPYDVDLLTGNEFVAGGADSYAASIAQIDVMRRYNGADYHYGTWYVPLYSKEDTIEVLDIEYNAGTLTFNSANSATWLNDDSVNDGGIRAVIQE